MDTIITPVREEHTNEIFVTAVINYYSKLLDTETDPEKIAQYREKIDDVTEIFIMSHTMKRRN